MNESKKYSFGKADMILSYTGLWEMKAKESLGMTPPLLP